MKPNNVLLIFILLTNHSFVYGQEEQTKKVKGISIKDIYIQTGLFTGLIRLHDGHYTLA